MGHPAGISDSGEIKTWKIGASAFRYLAGSSCVSHARGDVINRTGRGVGLADSGPPFQRKSQQHNDSLRTTKTVNRADLRTDPVWQLLPRKPRVLSRLRASRFRRPEYCWPCWLCPAK